MCGAPPCAPAARGPDDGLVGDVDFFFAAGPRSDRERHERRARRQEAGLLRRGLGPVRRVRLRVQCGRCAASLSVTTVGGVHWNVARRGDQRCSRRPYQRGRNSAGQPRARAGACGGGHATAHRCWWAFRTHRHRVRRRAPASQRTLGCARRSRRDPDRSRRSAPCERSADRPGHRSRRAAAESISTARKRRSERAGSLHGAFELRATTSPGLRAASHTARAMSIDRTGKKPSVRRSARGAAARSDD